MLATSQSHLPHQELKQDIQIFQKQVAVFILCTVGQYQFLQKDMPHFHNSYMKELFPIIFFFLLSAANIALMYFVILNNLCCVTCYKELAALNGRPLLASILMRKPSFQYLYALISSLFWLQLGISYRFGSDVDLRLFAVCRPAELLQPFAHQDCNGSIELGIHSGIID